jgi:hypothetical protein
MGNTGKGNYEMDKLIGNGRKGKDEIGTEMGIKKEEGKKCLKSG